MPFFISCCQPFWSRQLRSAQSIVPASAWLLYSSNRKPVPVRVAGSHGSTVSASPPVRRTIGGVP